MVPNTVQNSGQVARQFTRHRGQPEATGVHRPSAVEPVADDVDAVVRNRAVGQPGGRTPVRPRGSGSRSTGTPTLGACVTPRRRWSPRSPLPRSSVAFDHHRPAGEDGPTFGGAVHILAQLPAAIQTHYIHHNHRAMTTLSTDRTAPTGGKIRWSVSVCGQHSVVHLGADMQPHPPPADRQLSDDRRVENSRHRFRHRRCCQLPTDAEHQLIQPPCGRHHAWHADTHDQDGNRSSRPIRNQAMKCVRHTPMMTNSHHWGFRAWPCLIAFAVLLRRGFPLVSPSMPTAAARPRAAALDIAARR